MGYRLYLSISGEVKMGGIFRKRLKICWLFLPLLTLQKEFAPWRYRYLVIVSCIHFFFKLFEWGVESSWVHSALRPPIGLLWRRRNCWNDWQGKPKYSEETCPSAALSTTSPTCCPDANPDRHGGKPATNRLSYGTALAA
jgi:hypothetical protein